MSELLIRVLLIVLNDIFQRANLRMAKLAEEEIHIALEYMA